MRAARKGSLIAGMLLLASPSIAAQGCLRGINLSGAEYGKPPGVYGKDYIYPSDATITYFAGKGFNAVRLQFLWERLQPTLMKSFDRAELARLDDATNRIKEAGMTVILDPHNYAYYRGSQIGSTDVPDAAFADFWKRLARHFKNDPAVQFGLMNEPFDVTAEQWLGSANAAIAAIRGTGATNFVMVPGTIWSGAHSWETDRLGGANGTVMLGVQDPANNFAFEVHQYLDSDFSGMHDTCERADDAVAALENFTAWLRKNGKRGFLGEFGGAANTDCLTGLARMTAVVNENSDVWTGWTYWAAGDWWPASEPLNIQPTKDGDRLQLKALEHGNALPAPTAACPALK
ncbi:glycoside hydrolase family 5 protein [Sinorhizobium sp. BG8]|uniref:glycoside hydrolase family 5 protein n=1 Tax=Sinorhizobium sp. BG8 TaxID=2613773 RepID=UPI00193D5FFC|nr:glycoside hydrolase family 5 protein [Sinorhizobium sp. BG8]QRM56779.1 glycoside hydrolase family 5 protein [Sinorhizobium sp. BG8]